MPSPRLRQRSLLVFTILTILSENTQASVPIPIPIPIPLPVPLPVPLPAPLPALLPVPAAVAPDPAAALNLASNVTGSILDTIENMLKPASNSTANSNLPAELVAFISQHGMAILQNGLAALGMGVNMNGTNVMSGTGKKVVCPKMSVVFARGTGEPGNVGILTGPPFFAALGEYINGTNQLAIQGVDYEAQPAGFFAGGSMNGAIKMAGLVRSSLTNCPSTPLLLSGYSQGAQLVYLALPLLPPDITSKIASVVLFGDPKNGTAIPGVDEKRTKTFCHDGDDICRGGSKVSRDHLTYVNDATGAAEWAMRRVGELGIAS
ncbi:uncharacterized protein RAG0_02662 [Rhynchosporium agropyri]|uniref:cutinase n=1 Tax=Rhynchosporium agropyri TaxID=914238 RepID=A0A1E1K2A1_9HELO|nr:uncharacterized protein RAG0_02662 [Rhynchosporium agropyri]